MSLLGTIWVKLGLKPEDFNTALNNSEKRAERFGSFLGKMSARVVLGWAAISAAVVKFTKTSIKNYNQQEAANIKLQAALEKTGAAIGANYEELKDYASQLQKVNGFADDATMSAMATLTTFRSVQGQVFKDTIAAAQDMAAFLGGDLNNAVQQLGKALEAPEVGITMLRRSGVVFTKEMTDNIKKLVKEGKQYEAQMVILEEVNKRFGGEAARQADTTAGAWKRVAMAFGDLTENIGKATGATKGLATSFAEALETANDIISSEALTKWEKFRVIVLGIGQAKAAEKMLAFDKANKQMADDASEYAQQQLRGLDTIEKAQARLAREEKKLAEAEKGFNQQRIADHRATVSAINGHIQNLNEQKAKEEEAAEAAKKEAAEAAKRAQEWREQHSGLINELNDEIAKKETLRNMASDQTEINQLNGEITRLKQKLEILTKIEEKQSLPQIESPLKGVTAGITAKTAPGIDADALKASSDALAKWQSDLYKSIDVAEAFGSALQNSVVGALDELAEAIGTGNFDTTALVKALVSPLADAAITTGLLIMTTGESLEALKTAMMDLFGGGPGGAILAGAALMAIGVGAKAGLAAITSGSKGAAAGGGSNQYSYMGGYGVTPSDTGAIEISGSVMVKGQDIQIALDNYNKNRGR